MHTILSLFVIKISFILNISLVRTFVLFIFGFSLAPCRCLIEKRGQKKERVEVEKKEEMEEME